jgi:chromosomal replication initiator protein
VETANLKTIWDEVLKKIAQDIGQDAFEMWLKPVTPLVFNENLLKLEIPDQVWFDTMRSRYEPRILSIIKEITGQNVVIEYSISLGSSPIPSIEHTINQTFKESREKEGFPSRLNPNYTFDGFIEGPSNRFAYGSAQAAVKKLGDRANNPLVIYSTPGLGKTHLLHSIGNEVLKNNKNARVLYMSGEEFVNEYIASLQKKTSESFRSKYRNLDCLLIDDIQFVAGKTSSEAEFFYTFNALFESKKQIVLTSDRIPNELSMDRRLSSRLLSGIVAGIKPPDLETRIAILRTKQNVYSCNIPDDVIVFIATVISSSIREMEGSLIRLDGYCSSHGTQPTIEVAKEVLSDVIKINERPLSINLDVIKNVVGKHYSLSIEEFKSQKRTESKAFPRQIAMYLANELTDMSLPEIGRGFEKDHSTVVHARDKIKRLIETDPFFNEKINQIIKEVKLGSAG